jgi:hypothetical protein
MRELFISLSTLSNLFREERMLNMAEKMPPKPEANPEAGALEAKGKKPPLRLTQNENEVARAKMQEMLKNALKGVDSLQASPKLDLNALAANIKTIPAPKGLELRDLPKSEPGQSIQPNIDIGLVLASSREEALKTDVQRALEMAAKTKLTPKQANQSWSVLMGELVDLGPETNRREDNLPAIEKLLTRTINDLPDRDVVLAMVHNLGKLSELQRDPANRAIREIASQMKTRLIENGDPQLIASLTLPGEVIPAKATMMAGGKKARRK